MHDGPGVNISRTGGFSSPIISESLISKFLPPQHPCCVASPAPRDRAHFGRLADSIVSPTFARPVNGQNGHRPQARAFGFKV
jgi:hypothetical protein